MLDLTVIDLGLCSYQRSLDVQLALWERVAGGEDAAFLVLVEHDPPVITMGRRSQPEHLLASRERLAAAGVELHEVSRGGSVTWHGRGQLVGYPILRLDGRPRGLHGYIRDLEETIIRVAALHGVGAGRCEGATGVWVGREKLAAIGVAVKKWVTYHGFALNVCPDFKGFDLIVPCGLGDRGVTSLSRLTGREIAVDQVKSQVMQAFAEVLDLHLNNPPSPNAIARSGRADKQAVFDASLLLGAPRRLPPWFRRPMPNAKETARVRGLLDELKLSTVCSGARCPNIGECFACGTATFMILGDTCTRDCRFCAVPSGKPLPPREDEPDAVAQACRRLGLRHVVITCVTRDDLPDGGAEHFARTVRAVRRELPAATIEVLTSDFGGDGAAVRTVLESGVDVFNHNIETVRRLYPLIRPAPYSSMGVSPMSITGILPVLKPRQDKHGQDAHATHGQDGHATLQSAPSRRRASYRRSLLVLARASQWARDTGFGGRESGFGFCDSAPTRIPIRIKSGIMVGLGETHEEVLDALRDLHAVGCRMLTIGQYLAPTKQHVPVARFVPPEEFEQFRREALAMGFVSVASGPLVRSSYQAGEQAISQ